MAGTAQDAWDDGPLLPQQDAQVGREKKPKPSKKHKRKGRSLRDMAFETQQAPQTVMRNEMARGAHKPITAGAAVDALFGQPVRNGGSVTKLAHDLINGAPSITLTFAQWDVVQGLIEEGIRQGYAWAKDDTRLPPGSTS